MRGRQKIPAFFISIPFKWLNRAVVTHGIPGPPGSCASVQFIHIKTLH